MKLKITIRNADMAFPRTIWWHNPVQHAIERVTGLRVGGPSSSPIGFAGGGKSYAIAWRGVAAWRRPGDVVEVELAPRFADEPPWEALRRHRAAR